MPPHRESLRIAAWLVANRYVLLLGAVAAAALAYGPAQRLGFDQSIENMFAADDPLLEPYQKLKHRFAGNEIVLAAYVDPQLATAEGLKRLGRLVTRIRGGTIDGQRHDRVRGVQQVLALTDIPLGVQVFDSRHKKLLELFEGYVIGQDHQTAAVVCFLDPVDSYSSTTEASVQRQQTIVRLREIIRGHDPSGVLAGEPVMVVEGFRSLEADGHRLSRWTMALLVATILLCFRSVRWVVVPMAVVCVTFLVTRALLVVVGFQLSMVSSMLTAIITVISIATVIHVIVRFRELRAGGATPRESLRGAAAALAMPIVWSCLTDAAGFSSLLVARVGPVQDFGVMMATAAVVSIVSVAAVVPGLALLGGIDADPKRAWGERGLDAGLHRLVSAIQRWPKGLGAASVLIAILAVLGCLRLEVESDFTKNFRQDSNVVRAYRFVESNLGGAGVWDMMIPIPDDEDAAFRENVRRLQRELAQMDITDGDGRAVTIHSKVVSLLDMADAMRDLNPFSGLIQRFLPGGNAAAEKSSDTTLDSAATQLKLVMREPEMVDTLYYVPPDGLGRRWLRIMIRSPERQPSWQKKALVARAEEIARQRFDFSEAETTGFFVLLASLIDSMLRDQWITFAIACGGIGLMMLLAFRSLPLALVAVVPNVLPILTVSGVMGWLGLKVNMGAAMIAAVSIGLSVDSSIHYLTAFRRCRQRGLSVHESLVRVHQTVGRAMAFSTLALIVGFTALCISEFVPTVYFGALVSLSMLGGLAGNLIVLPLLLKLISRDG